MIRTHLARTFAFQVIIWLAAAGMLRAEPWPTREFEIVSVNALGIATPGAVELSPEARLEMENYLTRVAALYESWGFGPPALAPLSPGAAYRDAYHVFLSEDFVIADASGTYNSCNFQHISLNATHVLRGGRMSDFGAMVLAHELFHAVTWNTPFFSCGALRHGPGSWISEGLADAVAADAVRLLWTPDPDLQMATEWGLRHYDRALPAPIGFFQHDRGESDDQYGTSSFWRYLAESHAQGAPAGPEYRGVDYSFLPPMLAQGALARDCNSRGAVCAAELRWADFHTRNTFGRPLRDMYARFQQAYVQYPQPRLGEEPLAWWNRSYDGCEVVQLQGRPHAQAGGPRFIERLPSGKIERNAAKCYVITGVWFDHDIRLRVRVHDPTGRLPIQNLSGVLGRMPSSVPAGAFSTGDGGGPAQSVAWDYEVEADTPTRFVLTNMADDPGATIPLDGLLVEFIALEEDAVMGASTGPAQAFGALPIELDRFKMKSVLPLAGELLRARGMERACSLRFVMTNSATGDGVEIQLDHAGPIVPGTYNVAFLKGGFFDGPEEHVGTPVITFGIGTGNPLSQGDAQSYGSQTGTLSLDAFTADLVSGSLTVLGARAFDGEWEDSGWRDYPDELETLAVTAEFVFQPVLPRGISSMRHCIHPAPERRVIPKRRGTPEHDGSDDDTEDEEESASTSSAPDSTNPPPTEPEPPTGDSAQAPPPEAAEPARASGDRVSLECRPLVYANVSRFAAEDLPFRFDVPGGWIETGDGTAGAIRPADYPGGGIEYGLQMLRAAEAAQELALAAAMYPQVSTLDYGSESVPVFGAELADSSTIIFMLPAKAGRHIKVELLFKGRHGCDNELIGRVRALVLNSLAPK